MTIIESLITKLEKINNDVLIERLEVLERFMSAQETNRLVEERKKENAKQIEDIFGEKTATIKTNENITATIKTNENITATIKTNENILENDDKEEVIGENDIMDKFKWVMIGIGAFVLLIFIISIIYWFVSS